MEKCRSTLSSKYGMTVSSFPFKKSESSLFTSVARNLRPTCANPPRLLLSISALFFGYCKSCIKHPPGGSYLFQAHLKGRLIEEGLGGEGLFNLETTMVSVLHKELEYKLERSRTRSFYVMQPRIKIKSDPDLSTRGFRFQS